MRPSALTAALACVLLPPGAAAHSFGQVYTLPVPLWLYAWGAAAALVASFVVVGLFATGQPRPALAGDTGRYPYRLPGALLRVLQALSLLALVACIVTGLWGNPNPYANFNMTFFWIVFVLGFAYLTALVGDLYALINPWRLLARLLGRLWPGFEAGRLRYPARLGYAPALLLYMAFIWVELFGRTQPYTLALLLCGYTALNLLAVRLVGAGAWFRYGEFFGVFLRLIARMAPVAFAHEHGGRPGPAFGLRWPLAGLLGAPFAHLSLLLFLLFMLSSTAFDGLHESQAWFRLYWTQLYPQLLVDWVGSNPLQAYPRLRELYAYWQTGWLLLSPFMYLLAYLAAVGLMAWITGRGWHLRELALRFAPTLLPIALVYHVTHYYTLIQTQGVKIIALASDPFGRGQDWWGTAHWFRGHIIPDITVVWHVQVGLIVLGHIASVYLAHLEALRCFGDRRLAVLSQLPMLVLMVAFTTAGLWILAQPIQNG
jgi:hypothetical protein